MIEIKHPNYKELFFIEVTLLLILLDQLTKNFLSFSEQITPFFSLTHTLNSGSSFSLFSNISWYSSAILILSILILLIGGVLLWKNYKKLELLDIIIIILVVSGIVGNGIDRILYSGVIDIFHLKGFFIFNFADVYLTLAGGMLVYKEFFRK